MCGHCHKTWRDSFLAFLGWIFFVLASILLILTGIQIFWYGFALCHLINIIIIAISYYAWHELI